MAFLEKYLRNKEVRKWSRALIVAPTRELAQQIYDFAIPFVKEFDGLKIRLLKSGEERENSSKGLSIKSPVNITKSMFGISLTTSSTVTSLFGKKENFPYFENFSRFFEKTC